MLDTDATVLASLDVDLSTDLADLRALRAQRAPTASSSRRVELAVLVTADLVVTVSRFVMLESWVVHPGRRRGTPGPRPTTVEERAR